VNVQMASDQALLHLEYVIEPVSHSKLTRAITFMAEIALMVVREVFATRSKDVVSDGVSENQRRDHPVG
jgi:hypothetical protein